MSDTTELNFREQIVRIDRMLAESEKDRQKARLIQADHDRRRQEIAFAPWQLVFGGMVAGATLLGVAIALLKLVM